MPSSVAFIFYLQNTDIFENYWNQCFTSVCLNPECFYSTHSLEQWQTALLAGDTGPGLWQAELHCCLRGGQQAAVSNQT